MYIYIYIYRERERDRERDVYIYIYIYMYKYLVRHGNVLMFFVYGFHRRESRSPVATGNHKTKANDRNHKKAFLATTETTRERERERERERARYWDGGV